jgi:hypothetical protein
MLPGKDPVVENVEGAFYPLSQWPTDQVVRLYDTDFVLLFADFCGATISYTNVLD